MGGKALWRYVARAMVVARLNKLNTILRAEDQRTMEAESLGQAFPSRPNTASDSSSSSRPQSALALSSSPVQGGLQQARARVAGGGSGQMYGGAMGLGEREKEVIRMKIERLDGAKIILDREHALHGSGGGGLVGVVGGER